MLIEINYRLSTPKSGDLKLKSVESLQESGISVSREIRLHFPRCG